MSTQIGLGVQFTANASGMTKGLSQAERAVRDLAKSVASTQDIFNTFSQSSAAAAAAAQQYATDVAFLGSAFRTGKIGPEEYAATLRQLLTEARDTTGAIGEAAAITERFGSEAGKAAAQQARFTELFDKGLLGYREYIAAMNSVNGVNEQAAKSEQERARLQAAANAIMERNIDPLKRFQREMQFLVTLRRKDLIGQREYNIELQAARDRYSSAASAAKQFGSAASGASSGTTLQFNELSGILAALPGPLGNISGRLSGLASASQGLGRVFSGGISSGVTALGGSLANLAGSIPLAGVALAGFGAAAASVFSNLASLEERVSKLTFEAERAGVSFGFVQVLDEAARRSGTSVEALSAGLAKFGVNVNEARSGSGKAAEAFAQLGISQQQLASADIATTAQLTASALAQIRDPAERAALQMQTLGKAGEDLRRGFSAIGESQSALERFGASIDDIDATRILDFGRAFNDLKAAFTGLGTNLTTPFAGLASGVTQAIAEILGGVGRLAGAVLDLASPFLDTFGLIIDIFGRAVGGVLNFISAALEPLAAAAQKAAAAVGQVGSFLDTLTFGAASKIGELFTGDSQAAAQSVRLVEEELKKIEQAVERGREALDRNIETAGEFGQAGFDAAFKFQEGIKDLDDQLAEGQLSAEQYGRGIKNLQKAFETEIKAAREAARAEDERQRAIERSIEADRKAADAAIERVRIAQEFGGDSARFQATQTVEAIQRDILQTEREIAAARDDSDQEAVDAGVRRLAQLDQALAREQDIASGARRAVEERARLEERLAKQRLSLEEQIANGFRSPSEPLRLEDTRTASGFEALQRFSQNQANDPALDEYRKQLKELQAIRRELAAQGDAVGTVDILGGA